MPGRGEISKNKTQKKIKEKKKIFTKNVKKSGKSFLAPWDIEKKSGKSFLALNELIYVHKHISGTIGMIAAKLCTRTPWMPNQNL